MPNYHKIALNSARVIEQFVKVIEKRNKELAKVNKENYIFKEHLKKNEEIISMRKNSLAYCFMQALVIVAGVYLFACMLTVVPVGDFLHWFLNYRLW